MTEPIGHPGLAEFGETIFAEMSALAVRTNALNLGQGFPDTDGPDEVLQAAVTALTSGVGTSTRRCPVSSTFARLSLNTSNDSGI